MQPSNVLKINTLNDGWYDKDGIILHACFQILTDFVEIELPNTWIDWQQNEKYRFAKQEIDFLYHWWQQYQSFKQDTANWEDNQLENQMLKRLIDIRWALWT